MITAAQLTPVEPTKEYDITMSDAAFKSLVLTLSEFRPVKRQHIVHNFDGLWSTTEEDLTKNVNPIRVLSHSLNLIASNFEIIEWQDTRPDYVQAEHQSYFVTPKQLTTTTKDARAYYKRLPVPMYRAPWFDTDPDIIKTTRRKHRLTLTEHSIDYYASLARHYKMQFLNPRGAHNIVAYVSSCLEAIGTGYLTPPEGFEYILLKSPNPRIATATMYNQANRPREDKSIVHEYVPGNYEPITQSYIEQHSRAMLDQTDYARYMNYTDVRATLNPTLYQDLLTNHCDERYSQQPLLHPCLIYRTFFTQNGTSTTINGRKIALHRFIAFVFFNLESITPKHQVLRMCNNDLCLQPYHMQLIAPK